MRIERVILEGEARTRGHMFGAQRRAAIEAYLAAWLRSLQGAGIADPRSYLAAMLRETDFLPAMRQHAPDLLEETHGIAAGAECPVELILATQLMDEEWAYRLRTRPRPEATPQKCSSIAIALGGGRSWLGQNMDIGTYTDGHQALLQTAPLGPAPGALIFTVGSMIGLMGVNACALGVCVNSLPQLSCAPRGLPIAFVIRKLLQAESLDAAVRMMYTLPHATAQHYLLADPTGIRSFEASAAGVTEYHAPDPQRVLHTNHPLAAPEQEVVMGADRVNSIARLSSLQARLGTGEIHLETLCAALSSSDDPRHPVCRGGIPGSRVSAATGNIGFTAGSMISALVQGAPAVETWVSAGPPNVRGYTSFSLPPVSP